MDFPCNMTHIQKSTHYAQTFIEQPINSCIIGRNNAANVICACYENLCTSDCRYLVKIWKESKAYETSKDQAKCMEVYEEECNSGKVDIRNTGDPDEEDKKKQTKPPLEQTVPPAEVKSIGSS
ncbi:hypothetical protein ANCCAN_15696 [Ancylostoma caninum]|uniref:Uncharacterized protein n=1 Tax=Ancylostoma caninum TaxID=29170 RepID=A0A368G5T2_ANCCA|nr:hypothetical protein ANCCAN_15696 [Ancylostoma caninum]